LGTWGSWPPGIAATAVGAIRHLVFLGPAEEDQLVVGAASASPRVAAAFFLLPPPLDTAVADSPPPPLRFPRLGKTRGNQLARVGNKLWRAIGGGWRTRKYGRRRPSFWHREKIKMGFGDLLEGVFSFFSSLNKY
jgi:hypothetical protein